MLVIPNEVRDRHSRHTSSFGPLAPPQMTLYKYSAQGYLVTPSQTMPLLLPSGVHVWVRDRCGSPLEQSALAMTIVMKTIFKQ